MKKFMFLILAIGLLVSFAFADRNVSTIAAYTSDTLIKRGDWKVYRIDFVATSNGGNFAVYDSLTKGAGTDTNIKTEGSEATSANGKPMDFSNKPLEGSTGLYLVVTNANVIVEWE